MQSKQKCSKQKALPEENHCSPTWRASKKENLKHQKEIEVNDVIF